MKKNRIFILFLMCISLFGCSFKKNKVAYIGENKLVSYFINVDNMEDLYSFENMTIRNLYKIIEGNGSIKDSKKSFNKVIKDSSKVFISIGYQDLNNVINNMNINVLSSEVDLFHYYLFEAINLIQEINNNIYVSSLLIEEEKYTSLYILFNQEIKEVCQETNAKFIEINDLDNIEGNINDFFR